MKCDICGINPATVKNYVEINDTIRKMPACWSCGSLNGKSVNTLVNSRQDRRLRLIKRWWNPSTRKTLLPKAYPSVEWTKVRI